VIAVFDSQSSRTPPTEYQSAHSAENRSAPVVAEEPPKITDWLLVLFNGLLVGSTYLLWRATSRSVKIAERALTELERPFITVDVLEVGLVFTGNGTVTSPINDFRYQFINHGRTAAQLTELVETWPVVDRIKDPADANKFKSVLPDPIDPAIIKGRALPFGVVVSEQRPYGLSANAFAVIDIQRLVVRPGFHSLGSDWYFHGYVRYKDIFGCHYVFGFCALYDFIGRRFVPMGDDRYNYTRRENAPE
jgi:hypothetical protein